MSKADEYLAETRQLDREMGVQPFFMHVTLENGPQSHLQGRLVQETHEVVQIRFPGDTRFSPVFPVDAMWRRQDGQVLTYAERFAEQYRAFVSGEEQIASGTPLEMLKPFGMTPELMSYCRTMKIYSIEAIQAIQGQNLKNLGGRGNRLKEMAEAYMADRAKGVEVSAEMEALKAELAALKGQSSQVMPKDEFDGMGDLVDKFADMTDDEIKDAIAARTGTGRPRGNPSRETLVSMLSELEGAA